MAVNLAVEWKVMTLVLFHHEPRNDDWKLLGKRRSALWHGEQRGPHSLEISAAREWLEL